MPMIHPDQRLTGSLAGADRVRRPLTAVPSPHSTRSDVRAEDDPTAPRRPRATAGRGTGAPPEATSGHCHTPMPQSALAGVRTAKAMINNRWANV